MNKAQLVEELSKAFEGNRRQASNALQTVIDTITRAVAKGEKVAITGFGAFERVERAARVARNPRTGAAVKLKKTAVPKFRPGASFKEVVADPRKLPKQAKPAAKTAAAKTTKAAPAKAAKATKATKAAPAKAAKTAKTTKAAKATKAAPATKAATRATAKTAKATKAPAKSSVKAAKAPAKKATAKRATKRS